MKIVVEYKDGKAEATVVLDPMDSIMVDMSVVTSACLDELYQVLSKLNRIQYQGYDIDGDVIQ